MSAIRRFLTGFYEDDANLKPGLVDRGDLPTLVKRDGTEIALEDLGNGGSQPAVSCVLACDADFDLNVVGDVLWDALYDNLWDLNPLAAIPAGLGLTFAFDGSSSLVVPTEAGTWALSYFGERAGDANWTGYFRVGVGVSYPWVQDRSAGGLDVSDPVMSGAATLALPAGTQLTHTITTLVGPASHPSNVTQVYLSIVRLT